MYTENKLMERSTLDSDFAILNMVLSAVDYFFSTEEYDQPDKDNALRAFLEFYRAERYDVAIFNIAVMSMTSVLSEDGSIDIGRRTESSSELSTVVAEATLMNMYRQHQEALEEEFFSKSSWLEVEKRILTNLSEFLQNPLDKNNVKQAAIDVCLYYRDQIEEETNRLNSEQVKFWRETGEETNTLDDIVQEVDSYLRETHGLFNLSSSEILERMSK